jgi:hypothetical protein
MKKELIAFFKAMFPDKKKEIDDLEASLKEPEPTPVEPQKPATPKPDLKLAPEVQAMLDELQKSNKELAASLKTLSDKTVDAEKNQLKSKVDARLAKAIADKKIPAKADDKIKMYRGLLEANFDSASQAIDDLPVIAAAATASQSASTPGTAAEKSANYFKDPKPYIEAAKEELRATSAGSDK